MTYKILRNNKIHHETRGLKQAAGVGTTTRQHHREDAATSAPAAPRPDRHTGHATRHQQSV